MSQPADRQAPAHGARFSFELLGGEGDHARYRIEIATQGGSASGEARVGAGEAGLGEAELGTFDGPVEPWAVETALAFAKVLARSRDDETGWPRRLHRWRAPRG
jgi:hypothetical protein